MKSIIQSIANLFTGETIPGEPMPDELIRCRDCKFFNPGSYTPDDYPELALNTCALHGEIAQNNGFCSWAVRRDG